MKSMEVWGIRRNVWAEILLPVAIEAGMQDEARWQSWRSYPSTDGDLWPLMWNSTTFREIVSGRRRGAGPVVARGLLRACETPYRWVVQRRNRYYDRHRSAAVRVSASVISVGNLTLGGTGKTPLVAWIARWYTRRGIGVAFLSRGYGSRRGQSNDEALELALELPDVPHVQDADRVRGSRRLIAQYASQVIILDDGFQHRRIARDLDIVLLDALEPFGFEHVFPRGTLREPLEGLSRADLVVLSRADLAADDVRADLRRRVARYAPRARWAELTHRPTHLQTATGNVVPLDGLVRSRVAGFCGLGNPAGFAHTLQACGVEPVGFRTFPDHHQYTSRDLAQLQRWAVGLRADLLVCTRKDLVKLQQQPMGSVPVQALIIEAHVSGSAEPLTRCLEQLAARCGQQLAPRARPSRALLDSID